MNWLGEVSGYLSDDAMITVLEEWACLSGLQNIRHQHVNNSFGKVKTAEAKGPFSFSVLQFVAGTWYKYY
jgi:hypothetical protein